MTKYYVDEGGILCSPTREVMSPADAARKLNEQVEPGQMICECHCPCCGADLEIMHGDEIGQVGVVGSRRTLPEEIHCKHCGNMPYKSEHS